VLLEVYGELTRFRVFCDLMVLTPMKEVVYASVGGYDSTVKAVIAKAHTNREEAYYLIEDKSGEGNKIQVSTVGSYRSYSGKMNDLTHGIFAHAKCYGQEKVNGGAVLAWDGDIVKAVSAWLKAKHPNPLMKEWTPYIMEELIKCGTAEYCLVYSVEQIPLRAFHIMGSEDDIEEIVKRGLRTGSIEIPEGNPGNRSLDSCTKVSDYLLGFGGALAKNLNQQFVPLHNPGDPLDPRLFELKRKPYQAQADTIQGLTLALETKRLAFCSAEMGTGKTLMAIGIAHLMKVKNIFVMSPGHLVDKWKEEIEKTIDAEAIIAESYIDIFKLTPMLKESCDKPRFIIMSKDMLKLGYLRYPAVRWNERKRAWTCPDCGNILIGKNDYVFDLEAFIKPTSDNQKCTAIVDGKECGASLWSADNTTHRKVAPIDVIKRKWKGLIDLLITDEIHEMKGIDSSQSAAFGTLVGMAKRTLGLTGTLFGGVPSDVYRALFFANPREFKKRGFEFGSSLAFSKTYGVVERTYKEQDDRKRSSRSGRKLVSEKTLPGISPQVFGDYLLEIAAFLELTDVTDNLPEYTEYVELIPMLNEQRAAYREMEMTMVDLIKSAQYSNRRSRFLGAYINGLLSYADHPFDVAPITEPRDRSVVVYEPKNLSDSIEYPKEERLMEIVWTQKRLGRKCLVYVNFTKKPTVPKRLLGVFERNGIKAAYLGDGVSSKKRASWIADKVWKGYDAVIVNPEKVKTGLDLLSFPSIIYYETGYNVMTLRQAAKRSWRLGQTKEVFVFFMVYERSLQESAIRLIGAKIEASLAIEGHFSDDALRKMGSGVGGSMEMELAKALVEGLENVDSADEIWKRMGYKPLAISETSSEELTVEPVSDIACLADGNIFAETEPISVVELVQSENHEVMVERSSYKVIEMSKRGGKKKSGPGTLQMGWDFGLVSEG